MSNFTFWPEFVEAVESGDKQGIKSYITSQIKNDPTFKNGNCHKYMEYVKEKGIDIIEPFKLNASEEPTPTDKSKWTKELFYGKIEYLRLNFAYDDRIKEIEQIGKIAYTEAEKQKNTTKKKESTKANFPQAPQRSQSAKKSASPFPMIGAIVATVAVVASIVAIFKK